MGNSSTTAVSASYSKLQSRVRDAIELGDPAELKKSLKKLQQFKAQSGSKHEWQDLVNAEVFAAADHGFAKLSCIQYAALFGRINILQFLLDKDLSLRHSNKAGHTALSIAVKTGSLSLVKAVEGLYQKYEGRRAFLEDLLRPTSPGARNSIFHACKSGSCNLFEYIIDLFEPNQCAKHLLIRDARGMTVLHLAAELNDVSILNAILRRLAEFDIYESSGTQKSPSKKTRNGSETAATSHRRSGSLRNSRLPSEVIDIRDRAGLTPMMHAAANGSDIALTVLLNRGADPSLHIACNRHRSVAMLPRLPTKREARTALTLASQGGHAKLVQLLIRVMKMPTIIHQPTHLDNKPDAPTTPPGSSTHSLSGVFQPGSPRSDAGHSSPAPGPKAHKEARKLYMRPLSHWAVIGPVQGDIIEWPATPYKHVEALMRKREAAMRRVLSPGIKLFSPKPRRSDADSATHTPHQHKRNSSARSSLFGEGSRASSESVGSESGIGPTTPSAATAHIYRSRTSSRDERRMRQRRLEQLATPPPPGSTASPPSHVAGSVSPPPAGHARTPSGTPTGSPQRGATGAAGVAGSSSAGAASRVRRTLSVDVNSPAMRALTPAGNFGGGSGMAGSSRVPSPLAGGSHRPPLSGGGSVKSPLSQPGGRGTHTAAAMDRLPSTPPVPPVASSAASSSPHVRHHVRTLTPTSPHHFDGYYLSNKGPSMDDVLSILIQEGYDIRAIDLVGRTAVHVAAIASDPKDALRDLHRTYAIHRLIGLGVEVDAVDDVGHTALHYCFTGAEPDNAIGQLTPPVRAMIAVCLMGHGADLYIPSWPARNRSDRKSKRKSEGGGGKRGSEGTGGPRGAESPLSPTLIAASTSPDDVSPTLRGVRHGSMELVGGGCVEEVPELDLSLAIEAVRGTVDHSKNARVRGDSQSTASDEEEDEGHGVGGRVGTPPVPERSGSNPQAGEGGGGGGDEQDDDDDDEEEDTSDHLFIGGIDVDANSPASIRGRSRSMMASSSPIILPPTFRGMAGGMPATRPDTESKEEGGSLTASPTTGRRRRSYSTDSVPLDLQKFVAPLVGVGSNGSAPDKLTNGGSNRHGTGNGNPAQSPPGTDELEDRKTVAALAVKMSNTALRSSGGGGQCENQRPRGRTSPSQRLITKLQRPTHTPITPMDVAKRWLAGARKAVGREKLLFTVLSRTRPYGATNLAFSGSGQRRTSRVETPSLAGTTSHNASGSRSSTPLATPVDQFAAAYGAAHRRGLDLDTLVVHPRVEARLFGSVAPRQRHATPTTVHIGSALTPPHTPKSPTGASAPAGDAELPETLRDTCMRLWRDAVNALTTTPPSGT